MTGVIDRDEPCQRCDGLAARKIVDGSLECIYCGHIEADQFIVAKRSLGVTSR